MEQSLKNFSKQFEFEPKIINENNFKNFKKIIVVGMGGSHLATDILKIAKPELDIVIHKNYGLPLNAITGDSMIIISSYSGNTEEAIDAFNLALKFVLNKKFNLAAISTGGKLLNLAIKNNVSYVKLPENKIQPRLALGYSLMALLKIIRDEKSLKELKTISNQIGENCEQESKKIAKFFENKPLQIPIIYSSVQNEALAQIWKINFNETSKIPAFYNVFPELNHNEMSGLSDKFRFLVLEDKSDGKRIIKRMKIFNKIFSKKGSKIKILKVKGNSIWQKIFDNVLISAWSAYYLAKYYGNDPFDLSLIEKFKKEMTKTY
ncbi:hypothetical protein HZC33_00050 [Candidatus Wolfebacteria bacterium]|nr:hypothetical protein [Candidatus Wolfebacteria bacterium]